MNYFCATLVCVSETEKNKYKVRKTYTSIQERQRWTTIHHLKDNQLLKEHQMKIVVGTIAHNATGSLTREVRAVQASANPQDSINLILRTTLAITKARRRCSMLAMCLSLHSTCLTWQHNSILKALNLLQSSTKSPPGKRASNRK